MAEVLRFIDGKKKAPGYAPLPDTKAGRKMGLKIYILSKVDNYQLAVGTWHEKHTLFKVIKSLLCKSMKPDHKYMLSVLDFQCPFQVQI